MRKKAAILILALALGMAAVAAEVTNESGENDQTTDDFTTTQTNPGNNTVCDADNVQETIIETTVDENNLTVEGVYCAETGGHEITNETVTIEDETVNIDVDIEAPEEAATQVITEVPFEVTEELEEGTYEVVVSVSVDGNETSSISEEVTVGTEEEPGALQRFTAWLSSLLSF